MAVGQLAFVNERMSTRPLAQTAWRGHASEARRGPGRLPLLLALRTGDTPSSWESKGRTGDRRQQVAWQVSREVASEGHS